MFASLALAGLLSGCGDSPLDHVRSALRDPGSAEFGEVWTVGDYTCGHVNSRNGFGGMSGMQPFYVAGSYAAFPKPDDADWLHRCRPAALVAQLRQAAARNLHAERERIDAARVEVVKMPRGYALCGDADGWRFVYLAEAGVVTESGPGDYKFWAQRCPVISAAP
jgi:hypothetical protein